ncbi:MAG TPA: radical SAM protein [Geobacteraceae bacterium]
MRINIIQPTHYKDPVTRRLFKLDRLSVSPLTLPYLAALMPKGTDLRLMDEKTGGLDINAGCDVVFITAWTLNSIRAYELARIYRDRGVKVVMGGPHCYFYADEAMQHADAVVVGEGELVIDGIISDLGRGRLKPVYRAEKLHDLKGLPFPRRDLIGTANLKRFHAVAVQTSRGCPNSCDFCSERLYLGSKYRLRPVDEVIEEIKFTGAKQIFFADSTLAGSKSRTTELMEKLIPLRIRWSALWTADRVLDLEFMKLAKKSGMLHINLGIESIRQETLDVMKKRTTKAARIKDVVKILRDLDISFSFNLIFGMDNDTREVFADTLRFLEKNKVHAAFFNPLSPHRGTELYDRFLAAGRILDPDNLDRWPGLSVEIKPANFTPEELEEEIRNMYRRFYSLRSIVRRLPLPLSTASIASWVVNMSQRKMAAGGADDFEDF